MKSDLDKHKLLKILSDYRLEKKRLGISFEDLCNQLNINRTELNKISAELLDNEEIGFFNNGFEGLHATKKGTSSYSSEKYFKRYKSELRDDVKYYVQTIIPIVSLVIAGLSIGLNIYQAKQSKKKSDRIESINKELEQIHIKLDSLEVKTKSMDTDSLTVE